MGRFPFRWHLIRLILWILNWSPLLFNFCQGFRHVSQDVAYASFRGAIWTNYWPYYYIRLSALQTLNWVIVWRALGTPHSRKSTKSSNSYGKIATFSELNMYYLEIRQIYIKNKNYGYKNIFQYFSSRYYRQNVNLKKSNVDICYLYLNVYNYLSEYINL